MLFYFIFFVFDFSGVLSEWLTIINSMFQQYYSEPFYEAWEQFKDGFGWQELSQLLFYLGLNEDTRSWMDDGAMASGCPLFLRNANDAYFLFEDMENYNYHWYLSQHNA